MAHMLLRLINILVLFCLVFLPSIAKSGHIPIFVEPSVTSTTLYANTSTTEIGFTCSCFFEPTACDMQLRLESVENEGGHDHHSEDRPTGILEPAAGSFVPGAPFMTLYTAPEVSGKVVLKGTATTASCGNSSQTLDIRVAVDRLTSLSGLSPNFTLVGSFGEPGVTSMHVSNHHVTTGMANFINRVAVKYRAA